MLLVHRLRMTAHGKPTMREGAAERGRKNRCAVGQTKNEARCACTYGRKQDAACVCMIALV